MAITQTPCINNAGLYISVVDAAEEGFAPSVLTANFSKVKVEVIE